jgi:hypothetical protein
MVGEIGRFHAEIAQAAQLAGAADEIEIGGEMIRLHEADEGSEDAGVRIQGASQDGVLEAVERKMVAAAIGFGEGDRAHGEGAPGSERYGFGKYDEGGM